MNPYPVEELGEDEDDGTMPGNVEELAEAVVGHKIVKVEKGEPTDEDRRSYWLYGGVTVLTLDNGKQVQLYDTSDCCASTELESFLLNPELVDHVVTGVGTTNGYDTWHIFCDYGDILALEVSWNPGNPFYYGYGLAIRVKELEE